MGNRLEPKEPTEVTENNETIENKEGQQVTEDDPTTSDDICFICAEPVKYYSLSVCNHRTCHVCALRLRALYKKDVCTFCKVKRIGIQLNFVLTSFRNPNQK